METESNTIKYSVLDFTEYPGPRYKSQGKKSGEEFYEEILKPLFEETLQNSENTGNASIFEITLDNTAGYASSFLDESFGNLAYDFDQKLIKKHVKVVSKQEPDWIEMIFNQTIPEWADKKARNIPRKPDLN